MKRGHIHISGFLLGCFVIGIFLGVLFAMKSESAVEAQEILVTPEEFLSDGIDIETLVDESISTEVSEATPVEPPPPFTCPEANLLHYDDLTPVSQKNPVGNYIPDDLINIKNVLPTDGRNICLKESVVAALDTMIADAYDAGYRLIITSGFRDTHHQQELYNADQVRLHNDPTLLPIAAAPGTSEHQLGTAVDILSFDAPTLDSFSDSLDYAWLKEHAHEYGFVQSYQKDHEEVTGYTAEPWHWRYVGTTLARKIHARDEVPLEYLESIIEE